MADREVEAQFKEVLSRVWAVLKDAGYTKRGTSFRLDSEGNAQIVAFQRSSKSTASAIVFTINLGVVSGALVRKSDPEKDPSREGIEAAHIRERIGALTPENDDRWWTVTASPAGDISAEVADLVATLAIPFLRKHATDRDLLALWRTGRSPGLTERQRVRNLALLEDVG